MREVQGRGVGSDRGWTGMQFNSGQGLDLIQPLRILYTIVIVILINNNKS